MALPRKILVPIDFSDSAAAALDYAVELAASVGATVHLVHFYSLPVLPFEAPYPVPYEHLASSLASESQKGLANLVLKHRRPGVEISASARLGDARSGIQEAIAEVGADLVCMGTHGRRGLSHLFFGSVAEYTVRVSSVPTLAIRAPASE